MFQAGSVCYPTKIAANSALASQYVGGVFADGRAINVQSVTASSITYVYSKQEQGLLGTYTSQSTFTVPADPQPCQLPTASDALTLSWMVIACWVGAWALAQIARHIRRESETESSYGNT